MKTNKFIENSNKAMASFFLTGLVVLTIWCFKITKIRILPLAQTAIPQWLTRRTPRPTTLT